MSTPDAPWRVYLAEWVTVWTSDASGEAGMDECWEHFHRTYEGRVRDEDALVSAASDPSSDAGCQCWLQLLLPNLQAEFKEEATANLLARKVRDDLELSPQVVQRGSPEEQALLDYGRKMLPATG